MNPELEALVLALDAVLQSRGGEDAKRQEAVYESRLDDALARRPGLSREKLMQAVDFAHAKWLRAQRHPPPRFLPKRDLDLIGIGRSIEERLAKSVFGRANDIPYGLSTGVWTDELIFKMVNTLLASVGQMDGVAIIQSPRESEPLWNTGSGSFSSDWPPDFLPVSWSKVMDSDYWAISSWEWLGRCSVGSSSVCLGYPLRASSVI